jgi:DNA primase
VSPGRRQQELNAAVLARLFELRGWTPEAIERLGLGFDGQRVLFPVYDESGERLGFTRYQPNGDRLRDGEPKMRADTGTSRELFPPPERIADEELDGLLWLCEGEPDAVALWSLGLRAVGVPGAGNWRDTWAQRFSGRHCRVVVCFDCDEAGRANAERAAKALAAAGVDARVLDLAPDRDDGYDLSDFLVKARKASEREEARRILERCAKVGPRS